MKKITSLVLLLLSLVMFFWYSSYTNQWPFDYHKSDLIGYVFLWTSTLFILNLLAFKLGIKKYKIWLGVSIIVLLLSILVAIEAGGGGGSIVRIDGELITWFSVGLYSFGSIIYFIFQFFKNKK